MFNHNIKKKTFHCALILPHIYYTPAVGYNLAPWETAEIKNMFFSSLVYVSRATHSDCHTVTTYLSVGRQKWNSDKLYCYLFVCG